MKRKFREQRMASYIARGQKLIGEGKVPESMKLIEEGLNYYSQRIVDGLNPYSRQDAGLIILVLRQLEKELTWKNPDAEKFADEMEKCVRAPEMELYERVKKPNRR